MLHNALGLISFLSYNFCAILFQVFFSFIKPIEAMEIELWLDLDLFEHLKCACVGAVLMCRVV